MLIQSFRATFRRKAPNVSSAFANTDPGDFEMAHSTVVTATPYEAGRNAALIAAAPAMKAEIEQLRELVRAAYEEGFQTGLLETDTMAGPDWSTSYACAALTGNS